MVLIYVKNQNIEEVKGLDFPAKTSYRNPELYDGPEPKVKGVYIHGDFPRIEKDYKEKGVKIYSEGKKSKSSKTSSDFTLNELEDMIDGYSEEEWAEFIKDDKRKTIPSK